MTRKPTEIERALQAMERDTLAACDVPDEMTGRDFDMEKYLTNEMRADEKFMLVAISASKAGRAQKLPWLWDRYCDGRMLSEAQTAAAKKAAEELKRKWEERRRQEQRPGPVKAGEVRPDWQTEWENKKEE